MVASFYMPYAPETMIDNFKLLPIHLLPEKLLRKKISRSQY